MKIVPTHTTQQDSKTARSPEEQRFETAWQQVTNQQKENDLLREDVQTFSQETVTRIQEKEKVYMDSMYDTCLHLLGFLSRKSLTLWQRETLIAWVSQYLRILQSNPFSAHLDFTPIEQILEKAFEAMYPSPSYLTDDLATLENIFQDLVDEFEASGAAGEGNVGQDDTDSNQSFFQDFFKQQQSVEQQRNEENQALKRLMKSSSINRLFRKIAAVLHPDKETDEAKRQQKNHLMSELIQARNSNDIPTIFSFYAKYVGESPLQELGGDLDSISQLLERQYIDLRHMKESIPHDDPLTGILYQQFYRKSAAATKRAVNKHLKEMETNSHTLLSLRQEITSLAKLKPYLEVHYDLLLDEEGRDFF